ncbi:ABC transporter ATP-binding protein [Plantactinospora sp. KLBMP9567]|uniref:ABC transporter ATP-binding protein n=1 Tax=Plantactinospora sp. KLBMP9567 TaxID=3085900 RepID=UPI0029828237|nr:ABC transporter ATP-binding protein [Plantactinospora sp. KLBMP9567]MDW5322613.1 ABC transporter ATP-binding protein [Plantactinospora sp. KLBMP9567]
MAADGNRLFQADGNRLLRQAIAYGGGWTVTLGAAALLGAAAELLLPAALGLAVDAALGETDRRWPLAACGLVVLIVATDTLSNLAGGAGTARTTARLRHRLLGHLLALDPRRAARYPVGDLVGRLVGQAADSGQAGSTVVLGVTAALPPLGSVVALLLLDWRLAVTFGAGLLLLAVGLRAFVTDASAAAAGYLGVQGRIAGWLTEALHGARTIAAAGTVRAEIDRVLAPLPQLRAHGTRTWTTLARASGRTAAVAPLLQLAIVAVGGWSVTDGRLTPGQLFAAVQYAALGAGLGSIVATLNRLVRTRAGAQRVAAVLAEPPRTYGTATLPAGTGRLVLSSVTVYADDGRPVLDGIDLRVPHGATIAVVGPSGAGKSTLAAVAGRLRDPDAGEVLLDGVPLRQLSRSALRHAVGYGFERPVLIGDTIAEAITLGSGAPPHTKWATVDGQPDTGQATVDRQPDTKQATIDRRRAAGQLVAVARAAAIDEFVERLPDGYHSRLEATPMSGGEAQRLGLARSLHAQRLLILDDATSSLDTATEHRIATAVAAHPDRRTRLVVTHRVATATAADLVAWLDGGRLRGVGPHRELWRDPAYRAVFTASALPRTEPTGPVEPPVEAVR